MPFFDNETAEKVYTGISSNMGLTRVGSVSPNDYYDLQKQRTDEYMEVAHALDYVGLAKVGNVHVGDDDEDTAYPPGSVNRKKKDVFDYMEDKYVNQADPKNVVTKAAWDNFSASVSTFASGDLPGITSCTAVGTISTTGTYYCSSAAGGASNPLTVDIHRDQLAAKGYPTLENTSSLNGAGGKYDANSGCYYRITINENKGYGKELSIINSTTTETVTNCDGSSNIVSGVGGSLIGSVNICQDSLTNTLSGLATAYGLLSVNILNELNNSISGEKNFRDIKHEEQVTLWYMYYDENTAFPVPYTQARSTMEINKDVIEDNM